MPDGIRADAVTCWDSHTASSSASRKLNQGWRVEQVAERLGHSSVRTTLDWYAHRFEGHDDELLADLAGLVRESAAPILPPNGKDLVAIGDR